jgi:hypothetical protein
LAFVLRAKLFGTGVWNALEVAAVLEVRTVGVGGAVAQADVFHAGATSAGHTLLSIRARRVEAGEETLAVDADPTIATLEVELARGDRIRLRLRCRRVGRR